MIESVSEQKTSPLEASMFANVQQGPPDSMFDLKNMADNDRSQEKIDLGVGIYRNEEGGYHEMQALKEAKKILDRNNPGHDYECTTGNARFLKQAAEIMFGETCEALISNRIASVQTISGTGANHLGALFLAKFVSTDSCTPVYLGTPTWGNYDPLFRLVGFEVRKYTYYNPETATVDFENLLCTVSQAEPNSIFVLQGCCQNPLGMDLTQLQWRRLAIAMKKGRVFPFFDIAYQGLGDSEDADAYGIRLFMELGFEMMVCQSFSKNFGLYGERCGALHVVTQDKTAAANVHDQLRCLIRWEFSSSPLYGSRLVSIIMDRPDLKDLWLKELSEMRGRLQNIRRDLYELMSKASGNWDVILKTKGLFCCLPLSPSQCRELRSRHRIYLPDNGRINISGLNKGNIRHFAATIDQIVQPATQHRL